MHVQKHCIQLSTVVYYMLAQSVLVYYRVTPSRYGMADGVVTMCYLTSTNDDEVH